jgi:competence protein ComGC
MRSKLNKHGFAFVELLLIVAIIALAGFFVVTIMNRDDTVNTDQTTTEQTPEVNNSEDLNEAEQFLDNTDIDSELDTSEIDQALEE